MTKYSADCPLSRRDLVVSSPVVLAARIVKAQQPAVRQTGGNAVGDPGLLLDLVAANHILAYKGILDGYGHVSVRHRRNANRYLLSRSLAPETVTTADIMEYDLDNNPVDAGGRRSYGERFLHGEIYKARRDVNAVVHSHSPALIPFAVTGVPLRPVYHMSAFLGEGVPIFDIRHVAGITGMLIRTPALGRAFAETLAHHGAALMRGHGAVVVGSSLPVVVGRSVYLELNAKLQAQAMAMGRKIKFLDREEARKVLAEGEHGGFRRAWEAWRRKANPD